MPQALVSIFLVLYSEAMLVALPPTLVFWFYCFLPWSMPVASTSISQVLVSSSLVLHPDTMRVALDLTPVVLVLVLLALVPLASLNTLAGFHAPGVRFDAPGIDFRGSGTDSQLLVLDSQVLTPCV